MLRLSECDIITAKDALFSLPDGKLLIHTINAHSFNVAQQDDLFAAALRGCDVLLPDGIPIVWACRWLRAKSRPKERITGWDLFCMEMNRLKAVSGTGKPQKVMFLGSSEAVLEKIRQRLAAECPSVGVSTYSPPYKETFSDADNAQMISAINRCQPDLLWIGMTAPKQEKWLWQHWAELDIHCHAGAVGAVFDFYAGTVRRAPASWQRCSLEWLHRLLSDPRRMWRRYILGNPLFLWYIFREFLWLKTRRTHETKK